MTRQYRNKTKREGGIALLLFVLALPVMLGLTILGVDLGNLFLVRDKLNVINRSAAATAINVRALRGWAPLACKNKDDSLGYKCGLEMTNPAPQGVEYSTLVKEVKRTLASEIKELFPDAVTTSGDEIATNSRIQYWLPDTRTWTGELPDDNAPIYNLKTDTFQLKIRCSAKTILLRQLASLFNIRFSSLCERPSGLASTQDNRCWVMSSDTSSSSATTKARVILLLDTSGSMYTKQQNLKSAASTFIDYFNPFKDEIGIIPFGTGVKSEIRVPATFHQASAGAEFLDIKNVIANLPMGGQTNPCDALVESASDEMIPPTSPSGTRTFVVLFTDGAPNVYRLQFCDPSNLEKCEHPKQLDAISKINDWYGWTVKWGRRKTYKDNGNPVFDSPKIKNKAGSETAFNTTPDGTGPRLFRINERGDFMIRASTASTQWYNMSDSQPVPGMPFLKSFEKLPIKDDNYLWNGPSYLVNREEQTLMGDVPDLIDRVQRSSTTCGPPHSTGSLTTDPDRFNYNHSLYFASRVLDQGWSPTRKLFPFSLTPLAQQDAVHLTNSHPLGFQNPPPDSTVRFYAADSSPTTSPVFSPGSTPPPGCLDALDAQIPVKNPRNPPRLFVGAGRSSFWSNTDATSIGQVGEIIKTAELPYYCAIRAADYLRKEKNTTVFAVGLGIAAQYRYGETCEDPLQNALDFERRKDFFLQRLALAPEALSFGDSNSMSLAKATWNSGADFNLSRRDLKGCDPLQHPLAGRSIYLGFSNKCENKEGIPSSDLAISPDSAKCTNPTVGNIAPSYFTREDLGGYYPTSDPSKLSAQFGAIAKQILFRLSL